MISFNNIRLQRGLKPLLSRASAVVHPGQKVALIGSNGAGKSSLFQVILGKLEVDEGQVDVPAAWRIAHMAQEVHAIDRSAIDYVLDGDGELRRVESALARADAEGDNGALATLQEAFDTLGGYTARPRAEKLLRGLGFDQSDTGRAVDSFSGGWRIRLNLAQALMCPSDLLLLDEPTNHLDMDATLWLESWLKRYPGTLVLISHDRDFIDSVCDSIVHIERGQLSTYRGNYSAFERQRAEQLAQVQLDYEKQQQRISEINRFVSRFRAKATKARQAQSRLKELERMALLEPAHMDSPFDFQFPVPERFSDPLITVSETAMGYGEHPVLSGVSLSLHPGSRIALLGANGAGKSTLIKSLAGERQISGGEIVRGEHLALGYFSQHQLESLDLDASPLLHLQRLSPGATEQQLQNFLGGFNFRGDMALEPVKLFSGGEKARLALAIIVWQKPNLLLLDEPTNHLDLDMRHALTMALQGFQGAMVLVSHDRHLVRNTVDELWLVSNGGVAPFDGDLDDYGRWLLNQLRTDRAESVPGADSAKADQSDRRTQRQQAAQLRQQLAPLKKVIEKTERQMERLATKVAEIEQVLADPALYSDERRGELQQLLKDQGALRQEQEALEGSWLEQQERFEAMEQRLLS